MKEVLIDTDILWYYFKGDMHVVEKFEEYLLSYTTINVSIISYYEILCGLKHKDEKKKMRLFESFIASNNLLHISKNSASISAEK